MERASFSYFKKPRTVFWEYLFFGFDSPLRPLFHQDFFNLETSDRDTWSGLSKQVVASTRDVTLSHFESFGALLGYSYVFGIRDLHRENLVRCDRHLQVVDAEVVLTDLLLPQETLLLPFKECGWEECGLSLLISDPSHMSKEQTYALLKGYIDVLDTVVRQLPNLRDVLMANCDASAIRIMLRNTREYAAYRAGNRDASDRPFLTEEIAQLERGDVPYFFKRLGCDDVFWVSQRTDDRHEISALDRTNLPGSMATDFARHAVSPLALLSSQRIDERLIRGLMSLRKILQIDSTFEFSWRKKRLEVSPQGLDVEALGQRFVTKRSP